MDSNLTCEALFVVLSQKANVFFKKSSFRKFWFFHSRNLWIEPFAIFPPEHFFQIGMEKSATVFVGAFYSKGCA